MRPVTISRTLAAAVANAICAAQQTAGAADLLINGGSAANGVATLDAQRIVGIASTGNLSGVNFTVYGTDQSGRAINETIAGPNNNTVSTTLNFYTVTRVAVNGAVATNVTVGTTGVGASMPIPLDVYLQQGSTTSVTLVSGAANYTVQVTNDDVFNNTNPLWTNHPDAAIVGKAASGIGVTTAGYRAIRLLTNSGTGVLSMSVVQQGLIV